MTEMPGWHSGKASFGPATGEENPIGGLQSNHNLHLEVYLRAIMAALALAAQCPLLGQASAARRSAPR